MIIGLIGPPASGKSAASQCLQDKYGFTLLVLGNPVECRTVERKNKRHFSSIKELSDLATREWRESHVIDGVTEEMTEYLRHRPFFVLVRVHSPVMKCFQRAIGVESLQSFVQKHDEYTETNAKLLQQASIHLYNNSGLSDIPRLIESLHLHSPERLVRPDWDEYFVQLSHLASRRSNCMKRRVGCVIAKDHRVVATGYNGTPRGVANCNQGGCQRCNGNAERGSLLDTCLCLHAEENALLEAGRDRIESSSTLYCTTCPCIGCAKKIVQSGIKRVVYSEQYRMDDMTATLFGSCGISLVRFPLSINELLNKHCAIEE